MLLAVFGVLGVVGVFFLATVKSENSLTSIDPITVWGPDIDAMQSMIEEEKEKDPALENVTYVGKRPLTIYRDLVEAVATGKGPDIILLSSDDLLPLRDKLLAYPYESYPLRDFRDTYIDGSEIFALSDGIYAVPIAVDPLVLFWNRDLFRNAGVADVPRDWDTFVKLVQQLTEKNGADIAHAGAAFGEAENVAHATEIMSALLMQTGVSVSKEEGGVVKSGLSLGPDSTLTPEAAVRFYTDFSNPTKKVYTWNKTFERSFESFATNKVALYAGFASEVPTLAKVNPNLNFDISLWPQKAQGTTKLTYGTFYGLAIVRGTAHSARASEVVFALAGLSRRWEKILGLPTVRRVDLTETPEDPYSAVIVRSAIMARTWLMPARYEAEDIFKRMVNSVVSAGVDPGRALGDASGELTVVLSSYTHE